MNLQKTPRIKLSPHHWRKLTKYVLERDGKCLNCPRHDMLTPAHVKGKGVGGNDSPNNVICLCIPCHMALDQYQITLKDSIYEMLENEPLMLD